MVTGKRALIVDDSRSARVILSRMLEHHGLAVDTAESAEQALEFLAQSRPDVIFMDHLMPGMDGFQAVQAIKSDPQTATIPLMMYTSQEGELYVSQARALGAVGVLPKTVRPVDVSRVLYQLHLLPERRQQRSALFDAAARAAPEFNVELVANGEPALSQPVGDEAIAGVAPGAAATVSLPQLQLGLRQSMHQLLRDQFAEQRRAMVATVEALGRRMSAEFKDSLARLPPPTVELPPIPPAPIPRWPVAIAALLAAVPAIVLGGFLWQSLAANRAALAEIEALKARPAARSSAAGSADGAALPAAAVPARETIAAIEYLPYGEPPFDGARLERLRTLAASLEEQGFRGRIVAESHVGDFCLAGNADEGFSVAEPELPLARCALVGNPHDDGLSPAQRQSVAFANFTAGLRQRTNGAIDVEVANGGRERPVQYPEQHEGMTAGEWNSVAMRNNRVEFRVVPGA